MDSAIHGTWIEPIHGVSDLFFLISKCFNSPFLTSISILLFGWGLYQIFKERHRYRIIILTWFILPQLTLFLYSFFKGFYFDKYLYFTFPAFYLVIGYSISSFSSKLFFSLFSLLIFIQLFDLKLDVSNINYHGVRPRWDSLASYIQSNKKQFFILSNKLDEKSLLYYLDRTQFRKPVIEEQGSKFAENYFKIKSVFFDTSLETKEMKVDSFFYISLREDSVAITMYEGYIVREKGYIENLSWYKFMKY